MFFVREKFGHTVSYFLELKDVRNLILVAVWDFIEMSLVQVAQRARD
jgi:hypothetical protein